MFTRFKHPAFKSEDEVRIIIGTNTEKHFKRILHRSTNNFIVPYYLTADLEHKDKDGNDIEPEKLPITAVIIGPAKHQDLTAISVKEYLEKSGYQDVAIRLSKVPFRSI